jgi:enamine deaminase RidA (YjgF/YER057c/UK114 family)
MASTHRNVDPDGLLPAVGFSHATVAAPGRAVHLGGQTGHRADGTIDDELVAQFAQALDNLVRVLEACAARPDHLVSMAIYTTSIADYRASASELGEVWKARLGRHYPALALFGVSELYDPRAVVEVVATAVIPDDPAP